MTGRMTLALFVSLFFTSCFMTENGAKEIELPKLKQRKAEVEVDEVKYGKFDLEILSNGRTHANESTEVVFPSTGRLKSVEVHNGDLVSKGQVLARIDDSDLRFQKIRMELQMEKAIIELDDRLIDYGYRLKDSSRIPPVILKMCKIKSGYQEAVFNYSDIISSISKAVIRAPFTGKIANLKAKIHNQTSSFGKFCLLINDKTMRIEFMILESELHMVDIGSKISISNYGTGMDLSGKVTEITPLIDENGMVEIAAIADNPKGDLISGMEVKISLMKTIPNVLYISKEALLIRNNKKVVFSVRNGLTKWNYVTTGDENKDFIAVTSGLDRNDLVVVGNNKSLSDGVEVHYNR